MGKLEKGDEPGKCGSFDDRAYAERLRPPQGAVTDAQFAEWVESFEQGLKQIPAQRFQCVEVGYRILPKPAERAP